MNDKKKISLKTLSASMQGILGLQLIMVILIGTEIIGAGSFIPPFLKAFVGFIYLTLVPGFLILKILRVTRISLTKVILYSVGLSIAFLFFVGLLLNMVFLGAGISGPISYAPIVSSVLAATSALYVLNLVWNRNHSFRANIDFKQIFRPSFFLLLLLPFLSVLGAYLVNLYESNVVLLLLIIMIVLAVIVFSSGSSRERLYPLAVFLIAVSLLYHRSLITNYLIGWDIHGEYHEYNMASTQQYWNPTSVNPYGSVLSVSILPAIYSFFLDMEGVWIFKIVFPVLYALVPVGLFEVFRRQLDDKTAFLSSFLFMSFFKFFQGMLQLARQQIAEIFFVLSILVLLETGIKAQRKFLLIVFSASLVLSHYSSAFVYAGYIVAVWIFLEWVLPFFGKARSRKSSKTEMAGLYPVFVLVFILAWYAFVSNAVVIDRLAKSITDVFYGLKNFLEIEARHPSVQEALGATAMGSFGREISRLIFYGTNFFIFIGALEVAMKSDNANFDRRFTALAFVNLAVLLFSLALPFFPQILNATRIYHMTLIFLAPFCIVGAELFFKIFERVLKVPKRLFSVFILLILVSYFLFNTGFVFEITRETPSSISLSKYRIDGPYFSDGEVAGAKWLVYKKGSNQSLIYGDEYGWLIFLGYFPSHELKYFTNETKQIPDETYVFFRYLNVRDETVLVRTAIEVDEWIYIGIHSNPSVSDVIKHGSKIYDNGYCSTFLGG